MEGRCLVLGPGAGESKGVAITPRVMLNCYISYYFFSYLRQCLFEDCYRIFIVQESLTLQILFRGLCSSCERDAVGGLILLLDTTTPFSVLALLSVIESY